MSLSRQEIATTSSVIVVKVGSNVLTASDGKLDLDRIAQLAEELNTFRELRRDVLLVSSGAVSAGMGRLGLQRRPHDVSHLQAVAAVGQSALVEAYEHALRKHGRHVAQVLLTAEDLADRTRYLNATNTLRALLRYGAIPVINENDTVAVEELQTTFGDNDRLAALVANLFDNPLLILLTDVDGFFDGDPSLPESRVVPTVERWTPELLGMVSDRRSLRSKGGMSSKLKAVQLTTTAGGNAIIANGRTPGVLSGIARGQPLGTFFMAQGELVAARKRWIGFAVHPRGRIILDDGAAEAVRQRGKSLLAIGIVDCTGEFEKGDVISLTDLHGRELARGMTNYNTREILLIRRKKTEEIIRLLGHCPYEEVVHRDNMQLVGSC